MGFDSVWYGVVYCMNMHIAYLSPPFAPSAFYMKSITPPEITMGQIYRATMPYLSLTVGATVVITAWPSLSLWLPRLMMRGVRERHMDVAGIKKMSAADEVFKIIHDRILNGELAPGDILPPQDQLARQL